MNARKNERGQAIVVTVLSLVVLLGMSALVLDVGSWFRTKRRLQGTADAAALAGAQQLPGAPGQALVMAKEYADKNGGDVSSSDIEILTTYTTNDTISVKAARTDSSIFSKVLGINSANIHASAKARTDTPYSVRYVAPMVVSCDHELIKKCNGSSNLPRFGVDTTLPFDPMGAPGAFGMLNLNKSGGTPGTSEEANWILNGYDAYLDVNKDYRSDPGAKFSSQEIQGALDLRISNGIPLLFPVFERLTGTGQNANYFIIGWIGFHLNSYEIRGNNAILHGYFTEYIANGLLSSSGSGSPNFGVKSIQLID
jgi:Flp pilus assembly protein TadG